MGPGPIVGFKMRPGAATSADGLQWLRHAGRDGGVPLLDVGAPGEWDSNFVSWPRALPVQVTNKPRFSLGFLATLRLTFAHPYTTAAAQAPPNDALTLSTRSPSSESPVETLTTLTTRPKTSFF